MTTTRLFLWPMIIGPIHLVEQLLTSVKESDVIKNVRATVMLQAVRIESQSMRSRRTAGVAA